MCLEKNNIMTISPRVYLLGLYQKKKKLKLHTVFLFDDERAEARLLAQQLYQCFPVVPGK